MFPVVLMGKNTIIRKVIRGHLESNLRPNDLTKLIQDRYELKTHKKVALSLYQSFFQLFKNYKLIKL